MIFVLYTRNVRLEFRETAKFSVRLVVVSTKSGSNKARIKDDSRENWTVSAKGFAGMYSSRKFTRANKQLMNVM